jgi:hypothetical protein
MFVPRGWWHCVLNVDDTVAVTQNYVSDCNLAHVLHFLQTKGEQVNPAVLATNSDPNVMNRFLAAAMAHVFTKCLSTR